VAQALGHSRKTVAKALALRLPPGYRLQEPRPRPVLAPVQGILDAWLEQNATAPPKQGNQGSRLHYSLFCMTCPRDESKVSGTFPSRIGAYGVERVTRVQRP
jgi:hypothetical protein